jgi:hypothetical protein
LATEPHGIHGKGEKLELIAVRLFLQQTFRDFRVIPWLIHFHPPLH